MATTPSDSLNPKNDSLGSNSLDSFFGGTQPSKKYSKNLGEFFGDQPDPQPVANTEPLNTASVAEFTAKVMPQAERVASRLGVSVDSIIGQWGLETGWGKSVIPGTNNLGNIKDFSGNGVEATDNATGTRDKYKVFDSLDSFADGHADLLSRKYKGALNAGNDAAKFFTGLKAGGYAEDPTYVEKGTAAAAMVAKARQGMQLAQPVQQQPSAADNAPKWSTIIAKPEYLNMSAEDRAGARQAYFDKFIAPDVPMSQRAEVKAWFDGETAKLEPKEPSLLDRAKETIKKLYTGGTTTPTNPDAVYDPVTGVELTGYNNETDIPRSQRSVMDNYSQKDAPQAKLQPQFDPNVVGFANASKNLRAYQDSRAQDIEKARMTEGQKVVNGEGRKFTPIVNDRTWGQAAGDTFDAAAKIIPTALKGGADITAMLTNDAVGRDFSDYMQSEMDKIDAGSSPMMKSKRAELNFQMSSDNYSAGDILNHLVTNPSILIDQAAPSVGSMFLPAGAARGAIGLAARVGGNASKFATVATLGTVAAQNAADTFTELRGMPTEDRYAGAAVAATISVLAGIVTKGGAEGQIARKMIGDIEHGKTTIAAARQLIKGMTNEAFQEGGEEFGNALGEAIGKDEEIDPTSVVKRMTLAGTLGAAIGGATDIAVHASGGNSDAKAPLQPIVPNPAITARSEPVAPTATPVAEAAPTANQENTGAGKDLVDYAEYRKEILIAKRDGEAVDVPSEDGSKMVTVDKAGKGLSKSEQAELTAIEQAGTDAEKLAAIYPEMKETPANVPEPAKVEQKAPEAKAEEVAPKEDEYSTRYKDRVDRIKNASTKEEVDSILQSEYADGERHMEGTGLVERTAKSVKYSLDAKTKANDQQQKYDSGEWVQVPDGGPGKSAAEKVANNLRSEDPNSEYRVSSNNDNYYVEKRKKATTQATESKQDTISRLMEQAKVEKGIDKPTERNKAFQRGMIDAVEGKEPQRASSAYIAGHTFAQDKLNNKETVKNEPQATETALPTVQEEARQGSSLPEQSAQPEQVKAEQAATGAPEATAGSAQPVPVAKKPKTEKERNQQSDYSEKWFGSQDKAQAFIDKKRIGDTHKVVQNGKKFEIKAKAVEAAPVEAPKPKTEKEAKAQKAATPRQMTNEGRAVDGKPINGGDTFATSSGRATTPYPKQKGEKYASQWLIDNAIAEATARGDDFNANMFKGENANNLPPASVDSMQEYLFGQQPNVVPSILKSPETKAKPADDLNAMFDDVLAEEVAKTKPAATDKVEVYPMPAKKPKTEKEAKAQKQSKALTTGGLEAADRMLKDANEMITKKGGWSHDDKALAERKDKAKVDLAIAEAAKAGNPDAIKYFNHMAESYNDFKKLAHDAMSSTEEGRAGMRAHVIKQSHEGADLRKAAEESIKNKRTTGQAAVSAAKNTAEGFANAIDGLGKLFGAGGSTFGSGLVFNEETYAKAKPLFQAAVANFSDAGADIKEVMRAVVKSVLDQFGESVVNNMKPYIVRFVSEYSEQKTENLVDHLYNVISKGNMPKDNPALRKIVAEYDKKEVTPARLKQAQEDIEAAIARVARDEVAKGGTDAEIFARLESLYQSQPNLNIRTSTSVENQAYSTPAPLAFLAARLAGIDQNAKTYEPTAGNGMLLITANPSNATANELEDQRFANLKAQGFKALQGDALEADVKPKSQDAVITNPPFGSVKDDNGNPIKVPVDGYKIGKIDHLIAAKALDAMKDDGKATLILGADKVTGGISADDRTFFNWLYSHYNVTGHFEVDGKLYTRQGAGWPVRVISINGRKESTNVSPRPGVIERAKSWSDVYEQFSNVLGAQDTANGNPASNIDSAGQADASNDVRPSNSTDGAEASGTDQGKPAGGKASTGNVGGTGAGARGNSESVPAEGLANSDNSNDGNAESSKSDRLGQGGKASGETRATGAAKSVGNSGSDSVEGNEFQGKYIPRSARKDEGVLIPINMRDTTQEALSRLEDEVGDIDEFAAKELGYKSVAALHDALMGLQVDSVATAIHQIKNGKGIVIADQTGIGKGRQAASIIRWAAKTGKIPVFVTVKPSLFTDMYGDLADIGSNDIKPFILNMDESISGKNGEKLFANKKATHKQTINDIARTNSLPNGTNALFMTYSQINTDNAQRRAVMAIADKAVFILDESHNAAGESGTGQFMVGALGAAQGVTYLSATFAKRPDNIPLYFKTDIGDAIGDDQALMNAMLAGGLPLQTVVSNNLVKSGQMLRRERSYDGVSISTNVDEANRAEHEKLSDRVTTALRSIVSADATFHEVFFKEMRKQMEELGGTALDIAGNQATESVNHTEFSSVVHNFVRQLLLGLKADTAAKRAIAAIKAGKKPIIAVENTMGSFLQEYAANNNIAQDSPLGSFDYRTVLSRALDRTRHVVKVDAKGNKTKSYVPMKDLDPITRAAYGKAQRIIDSLDMDIPVSPIDWMRAELQREGYSVAEITGRNLAVDYTDPKKPVLTKLSAEEQKDKVLTTKKFNSGKLDALILNVAGSTGISLHASEKFKDKRPRHMIIAQAAQDINIFMQMLGRIHRTGQVVLPSYEILNVDIPAEKRPTALLSKKMKSLNANTSSNTESATSVKAADMMNKYGDQVVAQYLDDNPDIRRELGFSGNLSNEDGKVEEDIARKATGRLALMPVEIQKHVYADIEDQYTTLIEYLNKTNQNDLEPRTFDYDAKETKQEILFKGDKPNSPFGADAVYNEFSIKAQGVAMTPAEINAAMAENLDGKKSTEHAMAIISKMAADNEAYFAKQVQALKDAGETDINMAEYDPSTDPKKMPAMRFVNSHRIGSTFRIEINGDIYNAVVTNIRNIHKGNGSPYAMSKIHVTVAVNGALRSVTVPATQFNRIEVAALGGDNIGRLFEAVPRNERQTAKIITGNLLAAYGELKDTKGTIVNFTREDGSVDQGILLPKKFDFKSNTMGDFNLRSGAEVLNFLMNSENKDVRTIGVQNRENTVRVIPEGSGVTIFVPKSKAKGAKYFLNKDLLAKTGDFTSAGSFMTAEVSGDKAEKALDALMKITALYAPSSMADEAKKLVGRGGDSVELNDLATNGPAMQLSDTQRVATLARLKSLTAKLESGKITNAEYLLAVKELTTDIQARNESRRPEPKTRGAEWIKERLMRANRLGEIKQETADFALWFLEKYPHAANDLAISIRSAGDNTPAGSYRSAERLMTLFKGSTNEGTATHEILHHMERMMPPEIQRQISREWQKAWNKAWSKGDDKVKRALSDMLKSSMGDKNAFDSLVQAFRDGTLNYDEHYQLTNASEYWAVNATRIMSSRYDANSWIAQAKQFMKELIEKIKGLLKLDSDAEVLRALKAVLNGDGEYKSSRLLAELKYANDVASKEDSITKKIYKGRKSFFVDGKFDTEAYYNAERDVEDDISESEFNKWQKTGWVNSVKAKITKADREKIIEIASKQKMYHATNESFEGSDFKLMSIGNIGFISPDKQGTSGYGENVVEVKFRPSNPLIITDSTFTYDMDKEGSVSLINELRNAGYDSIIGIDNGDVVVLKESAIKDNGVSLNDISSQRETTERTQQELIKEFGKPTFSSIDWWDKSVGTQFHKAAKNPHYAKVFNLFLSRENATSITAVRAAELAPGFLPRVDDFKSAAITVLKGKKASKQHDLAGQAILEGTLQGDSVLQGVVWTDEELRGKGMDEQGIALYRQARQAIDASLDEVAAAEGYAAVQMFVPRALRDTVLDNPKDAVNVLRTAIDKRISMDMKRLKAMTERGATDEAVADLEKDIEDAKAALETMENIFGHSDLLKDAGYAPLMRFGKYFVSVEEKDPITGKTIVNDKGEPNTLFFSRYETEGEAQEAYFRMMSQHGKDQSLKVISGPVNNEKYKMYAGISPETLALFAEAIGAKEVENKFYQEAISERSALKRRLERKAIAGYSQDLPRVLANFITSNGRHAAGRYYTRDINNAIKYIPREKGDVQEEAQKLKEFLDNPEDAGAMASGLAFTWFLGGNPASAMINATQPVMMTFPYLSQWGTGKAAAALTKAVPMAMGKKQITDAQLRHDLKRASQEGKVDAQEIFHLYTVGIQGVAGALNGKMSKLPLIGKHVKGASESGRARMNAALTLWGMPFAVVEGFNRRLSFIAAWNMAKEQGEADPYAFAVRAVDETQGIYNKVNRPNRARSGLGRTVFTFTQFRVMNVELLKRMATQGGPAGKRAAALYLAVLILAAGTAGLPYSDDIDDIIDTVGQWAGYDTNMKRKKREWAYGTLGKFYGDLALYGMSSQLPMDFGGRMGLGNMIPATGVGKPSNKERTASELLELGGPVIGGLLKQAGDAYEEAALGNYGKAVSAMAPTAVKNLSAGLDMMATGKAKDLKGREKIDVTPAEGVIKAFGFNPTKVANVSRQNMPIQQDIALHKIVEANIVDKWAQGIAQNDKAMVDGAMKDMETWNRKNPDTPIAISANQIMSKAKSLMQPADTRMLKSAPKEMRGRVAAGLSKFD